MIPFTKMHGNGNDFVVLDARAAPVALRPDQIARIADRHRGVGFDQLVVIEPPADGRAAVRFRFYNADGSESGACGNGTRCVAAALMEDSGSDRLDIETGAGLLHATRGAGGLVTVDMGPARLGWQDIPLAGEADTLHLPLSLGPLSDPVAVNVGNPHCVFIVPDAEALPLAELGPQIEHHPLFPQRTNVELASLRPDGRIRLRVWERGAGITLACGSGACATLAALHRRELIGREAHLDLDGGPLHVAWRADGHLLLTGPVAVSFTGMLGEGLLA
ncbi:MAG: diaminopimelate epimerase [Alphaproteobacteria bacterium]